MKDLTLRNYLKNSKIFLSLNQYMENNSFRKKAYRKVKSSYITPGNFSNFKRESKRLGKSIKYRIRKIQ